MDNYEEQLFSKYKKIQHKKERTDHIEYELTIKTPVISRAQIQQSKTKLRKDFVYKKNDIDANQLNYDDSIFEQYKFKSHDHILNDCSKIDKKLYRQIVNDEIRINNSIDLHGMLIEEAYHTLINFIKINFLQSKRSLIVITGKGLAEKSGEIKKNFLNWINGNSQIKNLILFISQAHERKGGDGAFFIYLKAQSNQFLNIKS